MNLFYNKEDKEAGISAGIFSAVLCWQTDMFEILPIIRLCYGYLEGIFERELSLQLYWLKYSASITIHFNHITPATAPEKDTTP